MDNCFSPNRVYVLRQENSKPYVFAKLVIGRKNEKIF